MNWLESKTIKRIIVLLQIVSVLGLFILSLKKESLALLASDDDCENLEDGYYTEAVFLPKRDVYRVEICLDAHENGNIVSSIFTPIESENRVVFADDVVLFPGQENIDYHFWTVGASVVQGKIRFDSDVETTFSISIYRTYLVYRIISFCLLVLFLIIDTLFVMRSRITTNCVVVAFALLLITCMCFAPYFKNGIFFGADTVFHILRIKGLSESIRMHDGFPVFVQSYLNYGHGSIVSMLYSDLFLYIPMLLCFVGFPIGLSYKLFVFLVMLGSSIISYASLKRTTANTIASICGTAIFMLSPYHLFNFYDRGAVGEYIAQAFVPMVCCGVCLLLSEDCKKSEYIKNKWWLIVGMTGIIQSHLLSTEMVAFFLAVVCILCIKRVVRRETFVEFIKSVLICLGINACFLTATISALLTDNYNLSDVFGQGIGSYAVNINELFDYSFKIRPNMLVYILLVVWLICCFFKRLRNTHGFIACSTYAMLVFATLVLGTSIVPWDDINSLPFLGRVTMSLQFPWRFYSLCTCLSGFLCAYLFVLLGKNIVSQKGIAICVSLIMLLSTLENANYIRILEKDGFARGTIYTSENIGTTSSWNRNWMLEGMESEDLFFHSPRWDEGLFVSNYSQQGTNVEFDVINRTGNVLYVEIPLTAYYGYDFRKSESYNEAFSYQKGNHNDIKIAVPSYYEGTIALSYTGGIALVVAKYISLLSVVSLIVWILFKKGRDGNRRGDKICI